MEKIFVIKIGGNIIENSNALDKFLTDFALLNHRKVLVHGGGKNASEEIIKAGIEVKFLEGRRITSKETLPIVTKVYSELNFELVKKLSNKNCPSIGISGKRIIKNDATEVEFVVISSTIREKDNYVGDIKGKGNINGEYLIEQLGKGFTPIMGPLTYDNNIKEVLNTNADTIAFNVATSLISSFEVHLIYCFELKGVLENFEDKNSVIPEITLSNYLALKEKGIISKGMIPKLDNSFEAIQSGVCSVRICHADDLVNIVNLGERKGTVLKK